MVGLLLVSSAGAAEGADESADEAERESDSIAPREPQSAQVCIAAHSRALELRDQGTLLESREQLQICSQEGCPGPVQVECLQLYDALRTQVPSVVFHVTVDGAIESDVTAYLDERELFSELPTRAVELDPGKYQLRVEHKDHPPIERDLVVFEGEKLVPVTVAFGSSEEPPALPPMQPATTETVDRVPWPVYALGGLGVAGVAGFVGFGFATRSKEKELEESCSPECSEAEIGIVRDRATMADISLAVGGAALVAATVFYVFRPTESVRVGAAVAPGSGIRSSVTVQF